MKNLNILVTDFLEYLEVERGRSQKTIENYDHYLRRFLKWAKISTPSAITADLVRKYRLFLNRLKRPDKETMKPVTQNYHIIALRSFLKYLAKRDIKSLAAEKIELAKIPERQVSFLEAEELERFLAAPEGYKVSDLRDRAILELLFSTGMRVSELCFLDRKSINLKRDEFSVRGKGGRVRVVFLSETAKAALKEYLNKRTDIDKALFVREVKKKDESVELRLTPRSIQRIIKKYAAKAGLTKKVTPHTLRHTFGTDLLLSGADIRSVQEMLGHKSVTTTQIYTHITDRQLRSVYKKFHGKRK